MPKCRICKQELEKTSQTFNLYGVLFRVFRCRKCNRIIPIRNKGAE